MSEGNGLIRVCGLWKRSSKGGREYLGGTVGGVEIMVFRNDRRRSPKDPEYSICIAPSREREPARTDARATGSPSTRSPEPLLPD